VASVQHGLWYARSAEFLQQPWLDTLRWLRVIGDTVFAIGTLALAWFVVGLKTGWSVRAEMDLPLAAASGQDPIREAR
jgi:nitric oxide reductase subunit B